MKLKDLLNENNPFFDRGGKLKPSSDPMLKKIDANVKKLVRGYAAQAEKIGGGRQSEASDKIKIDIARIIKSHLDWLLLDAK